MVLALVEVPPDGVVRGEHIQDFALRQTVARRRQIAQAALHQHRPVIGVARQPVEERIDDARDAFAQRTSILGRVRLPELALFRRQLQIQRQAAAFKVGQHRRTLPRPKRATSFPEPLVERLPAFRLRHGFELDQQPSHVVCGRDDNLDTWRQLLREPGRLPRRVAGGQLIENIDEENQRLLRGRCRQPFLECVLELRVIDRRLTRRQLSAQAGEQRMSARRFGRRADEAPDQPARTLILLRGLRHHRGLARARFAVQYQRPALRPADVIRDRVQHRFAPGEDAAAVFGKAVVRCNFQIQRRPVFEALHLRLDHLPELVVDYGRVEIVDA